VEVTLSSSDVIQFAEVARSLSEESSLSGTVQRVVEYANELTDADDGDVVLLQAEQRLEATGASDTRVEKADTLQATLSEGPMVSAARTHQTYLVRDIAGDTRWPRWGPLVAELGLNSAVSTCLYTGRRTIGTLNVYSCEPSALDEEDAERMELLGSHAAVALDYAREENGLRQAIETRNIIGQAQGLLMERYGLDARRAFEVLRRYSQDTNTKLRTVAERLVYERALPGE
jgi:GAF domain-containing protein